MYAKPVMDPRSSSFNLTECNSMLKIKDETQSLTSLKAGYSVVLRKVQLAESIANQRVTLKLTELKHAPHLLGSVLSLSPERAFSATSHK